MTFCIPCKRTSYSFLRKTKLLWWVIWFFRGVAVAQLGTGVALFFLGSIALVNYSDSVQWFFASTVFGVLPAISAVSGFYSLRTETNIVYRLFQLVHLTLNLLLLPGGAYTAVLLGNMIVADQHKLSQSSWTLEEKEEESSLIGLRIAILLAYSLLIAQQLIGSFLGGFLLTNYPVLMPKIGRMDEVFVGDDNASTLELRTLPAASTTGTGNRSVRSV